MARGEAVGLVEVRDANVLLQALDDFLRLVGEGERLLAVVSTDLLWRFASQLARSQRADDDQDVERDVRARIAFVVLSTSR